MKKQFDGKKRYNGMHGMFWTELRCDPYTGADVWIAQLAHDPQTNARGKTEQGAMKELLLRLAEDGRLTIDAVTARAS